MNPLHAEAIEHLRAVQQFAVKYDEPKPLTDIANLLAAYGYTTDILNQPRPAFADAGSSTAFAPRFEPTN